MAADEGEVIATPFRAEPIARASGEQLIIRLTRGIATEWPRQTFRTFAAIGWRGERKRVEPGRRSRRT